MMERVVVGLSGGVDSSVAAWLLKEQGYDVVGLFMRNWHDTTGTLAGDCPWYDDQMFAELVAKRLDIPFHYVDLSEQYRARVVDYMFAEYGRGRTPNPDVLCNREIKFDVFLKEALKLGADRVATGHYCRRGEIVVDGQPVWRLLAGADGNKDQSYFLCQLSQEQLRYAMFPIGDMVKSDVRKIAAEQRLATAARKDSQGICFVGKVDLPVFLQQKLAAKEGDIIEIPADWRGYEVATERPQECGGHVCEDGAVEQTGAGGGQTSVIASCSPPLGAAPDCGLCSTQSPEGRYAAHHSLEALSHPYAYSPADGRKVGRHKGAHFYTIGQRRGLSVGGTPEPLFVIATDVVQNIVYVGQGQNHPGLYRRALRIRPDEMHWVRQDLAQTSDGGRFGVRIRYRQPLQKAILHVSAEGGYIVFDEPQRGITAGQFAAWYSPTPEGWELVGSGVIDA